jgi:hypothetical protein
MDETQARACREQARRYLEMSHAAETPEFRRLYMELAQGWTFLANEIERELLKERDKP